MPVRRMIVSRPNYFKSDLTQRRLFGALRPSLPPKILTLLARLLLGAILLLVALWLVACTTTSPLTSNSSQPLPSMPSASTPAPQTSYLITAQQDIQKWRDQLKAISLTP